jgi:hypothetical protein
VTLIPLTQHRIATLGEALEKVMKIEEMVGYLGSLQVMRPIEDINIAQLQGHIFVLTENI